MTMWKWEMEWMRAGSWSGSIAGRSPPLQWSPLGTSSSLSLCLTTRLMALASPSATRSSKRVSRRKIRKGWELLGECQLQQPHSGSSDQIYHISSTWITVCLINKYLRKMRTRKEFTVAEYNNLIRTDVSKGDHFLFSHCQSQWESCLRRRDQLTQTFRVSLTLSGPQRHTDTQ